MFLPYRRQTIVAVFVLAFAVCLLPLRAADTLPAQVTDAEFWKMVSDFSESGGTFGSDNWVSNERSYQDRLLELADGRQPASAYIGVGPEQNFTYILALKPRIAFIVDIRRQNMIEHLMYKALFELSSDRADFMSRLFSRRRPDGSGKSSTVDELIDGFAKEAPDPELFRNNLQAILDRLIKDHAFALTDNDQSSLQRVLQAFRDGGVNLSYAGLNVPSAIYPSLGEILKITGKDGINRGFLATEENFQAIQDLQKKNLLIPIVGDFGGPHAIRSVAEYLKNHGATVSAFYTSNVEQYLFQSAAWRDFYTNVATLPLTPASVFIRGCIRSAAGDLSASPGLPTTSRYETILFSIPDLVEAFKKGSVRAYADIVSVSP